jgi:hypothetical protein
MIFRMKNAVCECTERAALKRVSDPFFSLIFCTKVDKENPFETSFFKVEK